MADDLLKVLTRFHREVMLPDVERVVGDAERRIRDEMLTHFDGVYKRLDRLEQEYHSLSAAVARIEARLGTPDPGSESVTIQNEIRSLKKKVSDLQRRIEELESAT